MYKFLCRHVFLRYIPRNGNPGSSGNSYLTVRGKIVFQNWLYHFTLSQQCRRVPISPHCNTTHLQIHKCPKPHGKIVQFYPFPGYFLRSRKFHIQVFSLKLKIFVNYQRDVNLKTQSSPKAGAAAAIIGSQNYLLHRIMSLGKMRETSKC